MIDPFTGVMLGIFAALASPTGPAPSLDHAAACHAKGGKTEVEFAQANAPQAQVVAKIDSKDSSFDDAKEKIEAIAGAPIPWEYDAVLVFTLSNDEDAKQGGIVVFSKDDCVVGAAALPSKAARLLIGIAI
jgi:hypothetical protein